MPVSTRGRRTKAAMDKLRTAIADFASAEGPVTVRQTFYHLVMRGLVAKVEEEYRNAVSRVLTLLRNEGIVDWDDVVDGSRWARVAPTWDSPEDLLKAALEQFRLDVWTDQPQVVEVWLEKEALAAVVETETYERGVGLYINKGWGSTTFVHDAAVRIDEQFADSGKRTVLLYFGDWDPSGSDMDRDLRDRLTEYCLERTADGDVPFDVIRVGLNPDDITTYSLPTRPSKGKDPRMASFIAKSGGLAESVELDALPPSILRRLVRESLDRLLDPEVEEAVREKTKREHDRMAEMIERATEGGPSST